MSVMSPLVALRLANEPRAIMPLALLTMLLPAVSVALPAASTPLLLILPAAENRTLPAPATALELLISPDPAVKVTAPFLAVTVSLFEIV